MARGMELGYGEVWLVAAAGIPPQPPFGKGGSRKVVVFFPLFQRGTEGDLREVVGE